MALIFKGTIVAGDGDVMATSNRRLASRNGVKSA
jgi:hypothetical protein